MKGKEFRDTFNSDIEHMMAVIEHPGVEVIVALPGDTVVFRSSDCHAVITVYPKGTVIDEQYAIVHGNFFNLFCFFLNPNVISLSFGFTFGLIWI